ncbi:MAG: NADH:ubiquinone reductase (Na(+)-transporting) subunit B [Cyclobacteriaceae bacterium]|nr:NADH:ubiquinone reductase (Na(+)-transporting) subunit B [Cyclobacteriaceae bacterium]
MKFIRKIFDNAKPNFDKGGKWEKLYFVFEAFETFFFVPDHTTKETGVQIKDAIDMKRLMNTVIVAMLPCLLFGMWNVGHQHFLAIGQEADLWGKFIFGAIQVVPIVIVSYAAGLGTEFVFTTIRRHPVNEGYLVTGMLIPLVVPATLPLWQVAMAAIFSVVIAKEAFGGTGMNILNVALTARAFLYFAYPMQISGEVWTVLPEDKTEIVAGYSGATPLAIAAESSSLASTARKNTVELFNKKTDDPSAKNEALYTAASNESAKLNNTHLVLDNLNGHWGAKMYQFNKMFFGFLPGSIGETSVLMCLIGAMILIFTGVGSWKIIVSTFVGAYAMGYLFNLFGANEYMYIPAHYHLVMGGLAFGAVFMATDPVTAAQTETGKWIYGLLIGMLTVVIRVLNPAYPEGIMLAILLMNVFAPLIDFYVVSANKKRRLQRATV